MEQLWRLKESFFDYLSPAAKRRRTYGPSTPIRDSVEHVFLTSTSEPLDTKREAVLGRVGLDYFASSATKNPRKRARQDESEDDDNDVRGKKRAVDNTIEKEDLGSDGDDAYSDVVDGESDGIATQGEEEGNQLDQQLSVEVDPDDSISQSPAQEGSTEPSETSQLAEAFEEDIEEDEEFDELDAEAREKAENDAKVQAYLDRQVELAERRESVEKAKAAGDWHPDELYLFERIAMRSFEPLIPAEWRIDFRTLPNELFSDTDDTLINANFLPQNHGIKALQPLLTLGIRVSDNVASGAPTERLITREVKSYIKWSEGDGGYSKMRFLPVLVTVTSRPGQAPEALSKRITSQLQTLAEKHRTALAIPGGGRVNEDGEVEYYIRQPPLLYGIVIVQAMVIFVTLDSAKLGATVRHMQHFEFKEKSLAVWNGFSLAMMIIVARDYQMKNREFMGIDDTPASDVDA